METIHDHADQATDSLGSRLKAMRESRDWTLDAVADRCGLSKAFLSRLEGGSRQPSMLALKAIADAFGVSISALFEQPDDTAECVIIRGSGANPRTANLKTANGLTYLPLSSSTKPFNMHPIVVTVPADRAGTEVYRHVGEEWLHVVSGRLKLFIDGKAHVLEAGDSAHFDSRLPHRLDALDGRNARVFLVACPIPITLNERNGSASAGSGAGIYAG
jgi:transcriptional regulator with XRE-family HTH domain/quercetin dioxygenase-like cupin family protein